MPFAGREVRVPETQGPEEDGDQVLDPRVQGIGGGMYRWYMRWCSVEEDADQNVDHDEDSGGAEQGLKEVRHQLTSGSPPCTSCPGTHSAHTQVCTVELSSIECSQPKIMPNACPTSARADVRAGQGVIAGGT